MAQHAFVDERGRSFTWRQVLHAVRRRVSNRVPTVGRTHLDDALQDAIGELAVEAAGSGGAYYVDEATRLYKRAECAEFLRARTLRIIGRATRKAKHELEALTTVDRGRERDPDVSLSSANADPQNIVSNRSFYAQVDAWKLTLPPDARAEVDLLLSGATQAQIAARLGLSQPAVAQRLARLRTRLRALAAADGILEPDGTYDGGDSPSE